MRITAKRAWVATVSLWLLPAASTATGESVHSFYVEMETQTDLRGLDAALKNRRAPRSERHFRVIEALQGTATSGQESLLRHLASLQSRGLVAEVRPYWIANLIRVEASDAVIQTVAARPDVRAVHLSPKIRPPKPIRVGPLIGPGAGTGAGVTAGLEAIQAPRVWHELGIVGQGALIGMLDTGVDGLHPALAATWRGNNGHPWSACWFDVRRVGSQVPEDEDMHGTHVMGTMVGLEEASGDTIGVAWGAQWIAANGTRHDFLNEDFDADLVACFEWLADPDGDPATIDDVPDVIQNSWGVQEILGYPDCTSIWNLVIDGCEAAGSVVIFAAGNNGPEPSSLDSPADRATTEFNCYSVGAVDATNFEWPYPVAEFSSRGPTICSEMPEHQVKPEICAPGVQVYSSVPGGQYLEADGTSMAGPHVAGVVALMRSANPDIEVDAIKQILIDTARDLGISGEDNDYGWGFVDAYAAVLACRNGDYGTLTGNVTNVTGGDTPVPFARVRIVETNRAFTADAVGWYWGLSAPGNYTVEATHPSFSTALRFDVPILSGAPSFEDFALIDVAPPEITDVLHPQWIEDETSPIPVTARVTDFSPMIRAEVFWRRNYGPWESVPLSGSGDVLQAMLPGQAYGSMVDYYVEAEDAGGSQSTDPADAPLTLHSIAVATVYFGDDAEQDRGWSLSQEGDATNGRWARVDPFGTRLSDGTWVEAPDDRTPGPGTTCFVTGVGPGDGQPDRSDVDDGCVTLTSPPIDLSMAIDPRVSYWRWFSIEGLYQQGSLEAAVSTDDGGTWVSLEELTEGSAQWIERAFELGPLVPLTSQVRFRFIACDTGQPSLVEALIDDFVVQETVATSGLGDSVPGASTVAGARPNPFHDAVTLSLELQRDVRVTVSIFDASGRLVRQLADEFMDAGRHQLTWDGRADDGRRVSSGLYFVEVRGPGIAAERKVILLD